MQESKPEPTSSEPGPVWYLALRDAIRGVPHDYTEGPLGRAIALLAVPMVLEMAMESLFAVADVFWVSRLGPDAVATVGLTESMMILVYTLAMGLAIAATAVVSRRIGERDADGAAGAAVQAVVLGAVVSTLLGGLGAVFAPELLRAMGADPGVLAVGTGFTRVLLGGSATAFLLFVVNACLRGAGDAAVAMRVLWLANGLNIILAPLFIWGWGPFPALGVAGAAVATTLGRGTGVLYAGFLLLRGSGHLRILGRHLRLHRETISRLLGLARNATVQVLVGSLSWIGLVRLMSVHGSVAMAGYTIAIRIVLFGLLPAWGLSNAAATLVGQSLGARKPDRAEAAVWQAARWNLAFLGGTGLLFVVFAPTIVRAFTSDRAVAEVAVFGLRTVAAGFPCYAFGMVLTQAFNGAGDTATPTWINLGVFWAFELPIAWLLASRFGMGWRGIFVAVFAAYSLLALVSAWKFRKGGWRDRVV